MTKVLDMILLHSGRSNLPELEAYAEFFGSRGYRVQLASSIHKINTELLKTSILWCIMGYHPCLPKAACIVHDYRSLSVGGFARLKDWIKRHLAIRPDLRIFLNAEVGSQLNFDDAVPHIHLDMGLPAWLGEIVENPLQKHIYEFCYLGETSRAREIPAMLNNFLRSYPSNCKLALIGSVERAILSDYAKFPNLVFLGRLSQQQALKVVQSSAHAISWIPNRYPYQHQTVTKLLEYAALQKKIVVNASASNINTLHRFAIQALTIAEGENFPPIEKLSNLSSNHSFEWREFTWPRLITNSGILEHLHTVTEV